MKVRDWMSNTPVTCVPSDSLAIAAARMWDKDIGAVIVVDEQTRPVGVVTDRDVCMAAYTRGCTLQQANVASLLGRPPVTCGEADSINEAAEAMALHQVRRLPVIDASGKLIGVMSLGDLARAHRTSEIAGGVLAVVATPRALARPQQKSKRVA